CPFFAAVHAMQRPVHEVVQQTPSTQKPLEHSLPAPHTVPMGPGVHTPPPSQTLPPVHSLSGSAPLGMGLQAPFAPPVLAWLHARQVPAHAVMQQTPSMQLPLKHSFPEPHAVPLGPGAH